MVDQSLRQYVELFGGGDDLPVDEVARFLDAVLNETNESLLSDLLLNWEAKGTTEDELFALATLLRSRMKRIGANGGPVVDIVGTGGSCSKTFNVSTAAAFVVAGAGLAVAKHGNRAATSNSGSADVLERLGINVDIPNDRTEQCLQRHGLCFMFAPRFHSLSPVLARARRKLGRPTIFNSLGPLCNPAGATHQLIGVWSRHLVTATANVLARLGTKTSWVVHGGDGLDEIGLGTTIVNAVSNGNLTSTEVAPVDFGIEESGGDLPVAMPVAESARLIREILENNRKGEDAENLVLLNSAAAIYIAGKAVDLCESVELARESLRSGRALDKMTAVAEATKI